MSYVPPTFAQATYCEKTAAVLSAILTEALAVPLSDLPARLTELAEPCFLRHADCGNLFNVLGFALGLTLPTLPVPPDRVAALSDWLREMLGGFLAPLPDPPPMPANPNERTLALAGWLAEENNKRLPRRLLILGEAHPDVPTLEVPTADERRAIAEAQATRYSEQHGRLMRDVWRWWADHTPHTALREPFRELADAADAALAKRVADKRTPPWERTVTANRRTPADSHNSSGEMLLGVLPDLGAPYDLVCEQFTWQSGTIDSEDPRHLQLRRGDVTLDVGGATAYLKMLHGWATAPPPGEPGKRTRADLNAVLLRFDEAEKRLNECQGRFASSSEWETLRPLLMERIAQLAAARKPYKREYKRAPELPLNDSPTPTQVAAPPATDTPPEQLLNAEQALPAPLLVAVEDAPNVTAVPIPVARSLTLRQVALLYIYNGWIIPTHADAIAEQWGYKSGLKLYQYYNKLTATGNRINADGRKLPEMIKNVLTVIPHLQGVHQKQAQDELTTLQIRKN